METSGHWEQEAERATEESPESGGDEAEQAAPGEGEPVAGLDGEQQEGTAAAAGPGAMGGREGESNLADDEDPGTTGTDRPKPA